MGLAVPSYHAAGACPPRPSCLRRDAPCPDAIAVFHEHVFRLSLLMYRDRGIDRRGWYGPLRYVIEGELSVVVPGPIQLCDLSILEYIWSTGTVPQVPRIPIPSWLVRPYSGMSEQWTFVDLVGWYDMLVQVRVTCAYKCPVVLRVPFVGLSWGMMRRPPCPMTRTGLWLHLLPLVSCRWSCEAWCSRFTCALASCADCRTEHGCGRERPGHEHAPPSSAVSACATWCNKETCTVSQCQGCTTLDVPECGGAQKDVQGCAHWCNSLSTCKEHDCSKCDVCTSGAAADGSCPSWCNTDTCQLQICRTCEACISTAASLEMANPQAHGCATWCKREGNVDTCNDSNCRACAICSTATGEERALKCADWCIEYTVSAGHTEICNRLCTSDNASSSAPINAPLSLGSSVWCTVWTA